MHRTEGIGTFERWLPMQKDHPGARSHPVDVDRREHDLDDREVALDAREERLESREAALANRGDREEELLGDADKRDDAANARDAAANRRDMAASVEEFLDEPVHTATLHARGAAALDRADSRHDRAASKSDRSRLTDDEAFGADATKPCGICGSPVRLEVRRKAGRLGDNTAPQVEVRVCTNRQCPSRTGNRSLGDVV